MDENKTNAQYFWSRHTQLLDFVDLIKDQPDLKAKLKTRILDVAHEVKGEFEGDFKEE